MKKIIPLVIVLISLSSCYNTRVFTTKFDPSTGYESQVVHNLFWGIIQKNAIAKNCDSMQINTLSEVRVKTNIGYSLINVITLGIWNIQEIQWKCGKPCRENIQKL
jgi:hypothetical protein